MTGKMPVPQIFFNKLNTGVKTMPNNDFIQLSESEANKLEEIRENANPRITQRQLAQKSKIGLENYQDIIGRGGRDENVNRIYHATDRHKLENIAKGLNIHPTDFIDPDKWQRDEIKKLTRRFNSIIQEKNKRFVGRKFVFDDFQKFINERDRGYFTLVGDPGSGKSAVAAFYIQQIAKKDCVYYFNIYTTGQNKADQFLQNVCQQLIKRYELDYPNFPKDYDQDGVFFTNLLEQISEKLQKSSENKRLIIVIDALDEVNLSSQDEGSNVLYLPRYLPENVYFFLTRRRELDTRLLFEAPELILDLKDYSMDSEQDIKEFINLCFTDPEFETGLNRFLANNSDLSKNQIIEELAKISENNFMYLRYVIPQIATGYYQGLNIADLPKGLKDYYSDHWRKMGMTTKPLPTVKLNIIYLLCKSEELPSRQLLAEYAKVPEITVQEVINEWSEFLRSQVIEGETCYRFYHKSFADFLLENETVQAAKIELPEIHRQKADTLWQAGYGEDE